MGSRYPAPRNSHGDDRALSPLFTTRYVVGLNVAVLALRLLFCHTEKETIMRRKIQKRDSLRRKLGYLSFAGGILDFLFWTLYLAGALSFGPADSMVQNFESAFLFADTLLGIILILSGVGLLRRKGYGPICMMAAAAMAIYLGILDITFYAGQDLYFPITAASLFEIFINAFCILGGATGLILGLRLQTMQNRRARGISWEKVEAIG